MTFNANFAHLLDYGDKYIMEAAKVYFTQHYGSAALVECKEKPDSEKGANVSAISI